MLLCFCIKGMIKNTVHFGNVLCTIRSPLCLRPDSVFGMSERSIHGGWVRILLTSVIWACLSGTRQDHGSKKDPLQRETESSLYLKGRNRSAAVFSRSHSCTYSITCGGEPINAHTLQIQDAEATFCYSIVGF